MGLVVAIGQEGGIEEGMKVGTALKGNRRDPHGDVNISNLDCISSISISSLCYCTVVTIG